MKEANDIQTVHAPDQTARSLPRCSVVIPVYNRCDLLAIVLEGLANQTMPVTQFEVLVCDDGSTEAIELAVGPYKDRLPGVRHLRQENQGPAAARNLGIAHAASDLVVFLDSDVLPDPAVLERLVQAMESNPAWVGAEARLEPTGGENSIFWEAPRSDHGGHFHTAGIAYRKETLEHVGGFDENFARAACEDVELSVRMLKHGPIGFVRDAVVYHPRRRRTVATCWKARRNWRYVKMLACRYGFVAWPDNQTAFPRLRTAVCAVITLPAGRALAAAKQLPRAPGDAISGLGMAFIDWFGGLAMLPTILFAPLPPRKSRFSTSDVAGCR